MWAVALCFIALGCAGTADAAQLARKSVHGWTACNGRSDDSSGLAKAFAAASHGAFTLVIDCPVSLRVGSDIARSIFIDDGTDVEFTGDGKITVDNVFIPAFVIANSSDITLTDWNIEYAGGLPMDQNVGGYVNNGSHIAGPKPGNAFNDSRITGWLAANRGIVFDKREGNVNSLWSGTTNMCAIFFVTGDTSRLRVTGMRMYVPESAGGESFIPVGFAFGVNFRSHQTVTSKTPRSGEFDAVPHEISFSNVSFDGTYMGMVGGLQKASFDHVRSKRYGDLQDAQGGTVGGLKKWFAPPHLFYFSYTADGDPALFNREIDIREVEDEGIRVGRARDAGGADNISGYCLSLKLGCVDCRVQDYRSDRPDGFMDVLTSDGMTVTNVRATFDSSFINDLFPGLRFPSPTYRNVTLENVVLIDKAAATVQGPIGNANQAGNQGIVLKNVRVEINHWNGKGKVPLPTITGQATDVSLDFSIKGDASRVVRSRHGDLEITLQATTSPPAGGATTLTWTTANAAHCVAGGDWSGPIPTSGSRTVGGGGGSRGGYSVACDNGSDHATASIAPLDGASG